MKEHPFLPGDSADLGNRLDGADLRAGRRKVDAEGAASGAEGMITQQGLVRERAFQSHPVQGLLRIVKIGGLELNGAEHQVGFVPDRQGPGIPNLDLPGLFKLVQRFPLTAVLEHDEEGPPSGIQDVELSVQQVLGAQALQPERRAFAAPRAGQQQGAGGAGATAPTRQQAGER